MRRKLAVALIAIPALIGYGVYQYERAKDRKTDGFYLERIAPTFADDPKWDIAVTAEQITHANDCLNQPYHYLSHGFQCYAFISQDKKYVLKFIRQQRLRPPFLAQVLPDIYPFSGYIERMRADGKKRAFYLFRSLKVAFEDVPEETGLIFVHLNKTANLHPTVTITDKAGTKYEVNLDQHEFVLQRTALEIKPTFTKLMQEGKVEEAKKRLDEIFILLATCAKKGIADNDTQLIRKSNLGFLENRAIYIDTGKITRKESMKTKARFKQDLERLKPLRAWFIEHYPPLATHFDHIEEQTLANF